MKDRKGGEPRRLDDQEDGGDGVRAKDRGKGDKLRGDDGRKRRREERERERERFIIHDTISNNSWFTFTNAITVYSMSTIEFSLH